MFLMGCVWNSGSMAAVSLLKGLVSALSVLAFFIRKNSEVLFRFVS